MFTLKISRSLGKRCQADGLVQIGLKQNGFRLSSIKPNRPTRIMPNSVAAHSQKRSYNLFFVKIYFSQSLTKQAIIVLLYHFRNGCSVKWFYCKGHHISGVYLYQTWTMCFFWNLRTEPEDEDVLKCALYNGHMIIIINVLTEQLRKNSLEVSPRCRGRTSCSACCGDVIGLMEKMTKTNISRKATLFRKKSVHICMCSSYNFEF